MCQLQPDGISDTRRKDKDIKGTHDLWEEE